VSEQIDLQAYIATLPEVDTARLPRGTIFTANDLLYQVTEAGAGGFRKARQWRGGEQTEVALVPGTFLTKFLPLVARGRLLPVFPTRRDLAGDGQLIYYLFPNERQALDAAYLDVALVQSGDVYVRNYGREPAFAATDGIQTFRVYYYSRTVHGHPTQITSDATSRTIQFCPYVRGPMHWRLLPSWPDILSSSEPTRPNIRAVSPPDAYPPGETPDSSAT
jgi:hypothetical protein